jgi:hypothetical protein
MNGLDDHSVVHITYEAEAELPTEPEWEFAARGGLDGMDFNWEMMIHSFPDPGLIPGNENSLTRIY